MRLSSIHAGDVVAIPGPHEPRLGEVRGKQRGRLAVAPLAGPGGRATGPQS